MQPRILPALLPLTCTALLLQSVVEARAHDGETLKILLVGGRTTTGKLPRLVNPEVTHLRIWSLSQLIACRS